MDSQIRTLIHELRLIGKENSEGRIAADIAALARATSEVIDSFHGVLDAGVVRGVVAVAEARPGQEAAVVLLKSTLEDADEHTCK